MADVFISYARPDRPFVDKLADILRTSGLSVWFDQSLTVGEEFSEEIESEARSARCCVVVWSQTSVDRPWVRAEAQLAHQLGTLVPVMLENCDIPLPFNGLHTQTLPRDGELDSGAPAIKTIKQRVSQTIEDVRRKRREPPIGQDLIRQMLIERAQNDSESPGDFIENHRIEFERLRFYPLMVGIVRWRGTVNASIGYHEEEQYIEKVNKPNPSGPGFVTELETETRMVTKWRPHSNEQSGTIEVALPGIETDSDIGKALMDFARANAYAVDELPEAAEMVRPVSNVLALQGNKGFVESAIKRQAETELPGDEKRDIEVNETIDASDTKIIYLPIWTARVSYGGTVTPLTASGIDGGDMIYKMPKDAELLADQDSRRHASQWTLGFGALTVVLGAAALFINQMAMSVWVPAALAPLAFYSAYHLARWPIVDLTLARKIFARKSQNTERRSKAAAAVGLRSNPISAKTSTGGTGVSISHGISWIAALLAGGVGLYLAFEAKSVLGF